MELEAQDGIKLILLMAAGAIFALSGLWLLLRPKPTGSAAKIELFGLKFESSSAGVLVFLIGAAFLTIPLFVEEKAAGANSVSSGPGVSMTNDTDKTESGEDLSDQKIIANSQSGAAALILPPDPQVKEIEPNNRVQEAIQVAFGQTVAGYATNDDEFDWFVVPMPENLPRFVEIKVRASNASPGSSVQAEVFNAREEQLGSLSVSANVAYRKVEHRSDDRLYVKMAYRSSFSGSVDYEWTLLTVPDE